jgi:outer membrane protein OmpA-like peptidoglycan-associated protein
MAVAVGCMALTAAVLTGCGGGSDSSGTGSSSLPPCLAPGQPVAIAVGARSNSPNPDYTPSVLAALQSAINAHKAITIIRLDGDPKILFSRAYTGVGANSQTRQANYNNYISAVNAILYNSSAQVPDIKAQVPQADVLKALQIAASAVPPRGNVIVLDSGLQTTAPLNFADGLLGDDPQTIVSFLRTGRELPTDLAGRHVDFEGLGWTAAPQPNLDTKYQGRVAQVWQDIATAAGASCAYADLLANTSDSVPGRPAVTVVQPPPPPPQSPRPCSVIPLNDTNNVGFVVGTTTFVHPSEARATLQRLATLMQSAGESVTLTGATSSEGTEASNDQLSLERAQAIRDVLVQLGIPASRITTYGVGSHLPGRLNDIGPNGQLLVGPAIQNRKVVAKLTGAGCPRS